MQQHKLDKILPSALAVCARAGIITARLGTNQTWKEISVSTDYK